MNKREFITALKDMTKQLENDSFKFIDLEQGYIFANRNYGEISIPVAKGININVRLFTTEDSEKGGN